MEIGKREKIYFAASALGIALSIFLYLYSKQTVAVAISGIVLSISIVIGLLYPLVISKRMPSASVDLDLTFLLQHMLSVSTGSPPRATIFEVVGKENLYPKYSPILLKIYKLGKEWGYSFPQACRIVAREVSNRVLREILSRLSTVLAIGEDVEVFLRTEFMTIISEFETQYMRATEASRVFLGIYTSLLASSVFMLANFLLLAFFFGGSIDMVVASYFFVLATIASVAVLLYLTMPAEVYENKLEPKPKTYKHIDILATVISALGIAGFIALSTTTSIDFFIMGVFLSILGGLYYIPGKFAKKIEDLVREIDDFFPVFIRTYSLNYETLPNMAKALKPMLIVELGKLTKILENLYSRLVNSIDPQIAWRMVAAESRSELARRFLKIFIDTVEKGGKISQVGASLSDHHNTIVRLRRNRSQVAKTFETTTYIMQAAIVIINVFVASLLQGFSQILASMQAQIPSNIMGPIFGSNIPLQPVIIMSVAFSLGAAVLNALSINRVTPGVSRSFWYYLAILLIVTGIGIIIGDAMMRYILGSTMESLKNLTLL